MNTDDLLGGYMDSGLARMQKQVEDSFNEKNPVVKVYKGLIDYVIEFEKDLDEDHELGARLVSFGSTVTFHVQHISYTLPSLITFQGITESNEKVQLVQHISQLSFLLVSVPKLAQKPRRIGFIQDDEQA